jgi:hypothetical protein
MKRGGDEIGGTCSRTEGMLEDKMKNIYPSYLVILTHINSYDYINIVEKV